MHIEALNYSQQSDSNESHIGSTQVGRISLRDYLHYNDVLYYGTPEERMIQSFRMLDLTNG